MADDRVEQLLRGYRLPEPSPGLDHRVLADVTAILEREPAGMVWDDIVAAVPTMRTVGTSHGRLRRKRARRSARSASRSESM